MRSPIFLFAVPRSGSTMLQRMLMTHPQIASTSEPWLMLMLAYMTRSQGILAEYDQQSYYEAAKEFIQLLPGQEETFRTAIHDFAAQLYGSLCQQGERYFLDKTPRYYEIIDEIYGSFPDAKYIFLFRQPLAVHNSVLSTWCDDRFKTMFRFQRDLYEGPRKLAAAYEKYKETSFAMKYEDLVADPSAHLSQLCDYLEIDFDKEMVAGFQSRELQGTMGDPTRNRQSSGVSQQGVTKWARNITSDYRRKLAINYLDDLGDRTLSTMGYDSDELKQAVKGLKVRPGLAIRDRLDRSYSWLVRYLKPNIFFGDRLKSWTRGTHLG